MLLEKTCLSYDATSGSDKMPCNKVDKPLAVYIFSNIMYCKFRNFCEVIFSRNFAYAKFHENKILAKWLNHSVDY